MKPSLDYFRMIRLILCFYLLPFTAAADGSWQQLNSFQYGARAGMFYFQIGSKCFAGGGTNGSTFYNEFYEYFPATDTWQPKAPLPMIGLAYGVGFAINGKGYAGIGQQVMLLPVMLF
ncbi:MAG: hypothetical protein IPN36_10830 [Bacteroidetes bacterium]|nr:hypothetical protein [Bacteroidota bacterium]